MAPLLVHQPGQVLCAGHYAEHGELGQRSAVHAGRGGERDSPQFLGVNPAALTAPPPPAAMVCTHRRSGVGLDRPPQRVGIDVGNAIERLGRVEHRFERLLLIHRPAERRVAAEVSGMAHRWIHRLVPDQVDPRLQALHELAQLLGQRCGHHDPESI